MEPGVPGGAGTPPGMIDGTAQTTGRHVLVFAQDDLDARPFLQRIAGVTEVADSRDFAGQAMNMAEADEAEAEVFGELGMAVMTLDPDRLAALRTSHEAQGSVVAVVPELVHHVLPGPTGGYLQGYRDGVLDLTSRLGGEEPGEESDDSREMGAARRYEDDELATWGLHATGVDGCSGTGAGVAVAVLDTGLDLQHPDFVGRGVTAASFVAGVGSVQDGHGHGTHCTGTACGPHEPESGPRYGIAWGADVHVGKVLADEGYGRDGWILAGINWAVASGCAVISMSLGADVRRPHPPYSVAGRRALRRGTLIVAAAGNNANRPDDPGFVGSPANSPDILAVGALDARLRIAPFSARTLPGRGGQVDIAGPGVGVYSSWPMPTRYESISGTSMATPHVAGIAALWAEKAERRGLELWATLAKESRRTRRRAADVGSGLVLAPQ